MVPAAQDAVAAHHQRHVDAQLMENARKLVGDIAAARDHDALGQGFEVEGLVRGDCEVRPRDRGQCGGSPGGDQDLVRRDPLLADLQGMRIEERRARAFQLDMMIGQRVLVDFVDPVHVGEHIVAQCGPVERRRPHVPAEALRVRQVFSEMRSVDEQLLGHAPADDAGAPHAILLRDRDARAVPRRNPGRAHPARARADNEIIIVVSHLADLG